MAEQINNLNERNETHNDEEIVRFAKEQIKKHEEQQNQHNERESQPSIEEITKKIEQTAKSTEEVVTKHESENHHQSNHHATSSNKINHVSRPQVLSRVQKHLSPTEKKFSKLIHNPAVEITSDVAGGTIARPYGLLYGAVFSLLSSLGLYLFARHYGYEYPFSVGLLFFAGGFIFGLFVELLLKMFKKK